MALIKKVDLNLVNDYRFPKLKTISIDTALSILTNSVIQYGAIYGMPFICLPLKISEASHVLELIKVINIFYIILCNFIQIKL